MSTIKNRLKVLRTEKGITQDQLAEIINKRLKENEKPISKMVISNWENNKHTIKPEKAQQLADYFGVTTGFLLGFGTLEEELEYDRKEMYKLFQKEDDALLSLGHLLSDNDIEHVLQLIHLLSSKNESYFWKSIELKDVSYSYDNNETYALKNISFTVKKGEYIGIVGLSGSGKSTLLSLLMGILRPTKGHIYINGKDIHNYDASMIRNIMGYVFQNADLFKGSIQDNLNLYDSSISMDTIIDATKKVKLHDMIESLPDGYQTSVGYLGSLLSDGQKQLLAFARTLILNKPILLLDEATANIDSHTELQIQDSIETIRGEKTIINVAHRLSTVQKANRIFVLSYGNIVESGPFEELMQHKGDFYQLWNHQK